MEIRQVMYILWVADMSRALGFWRDTIGLDVRMESPHWSELTHAGAVPALHPGGDGTFKDTGLGLRVGDIDTACAEIVAGGGSIRSGPVARPGEPIKLAEATDPEGNGFNVSQFIG